MELGIICPTAARSQKCECAEFLLDELHQLKLPRSLYVRYPELIACIFPTNDVIWASLGCCASFHPLMFAWIKFVNLHYATRVPPLIGTCRKLCLTAGRLVQLIALVLSHKSDPSCDYLERTDVVLLTVVFKISFTRLSPLTLVNSHK